MNMKRIFDVSFSVLGLALLAPVFLIIAMAIRLDSPGPVFFRQERIGYRGTPFRIVKFRTMQHSVARAGLLVTVGSDRRITRIGNVLRKWKLDELPQLLNIVKGEMSLVGPRPEVARFMQHYDAEQREIILSVKPGITDFAAIEFRNESKLLEQSSDPEKTYINEIMPQKFLLYQKYIENRSMALDIKLIFLTLANIF